MAERGIAVDHETVHRWIVRYSSDLRERFNRHRYFHTAGDFLVCSGLLASLRFRGATDRRAKICLEVSHGHHRRSF
jgi:hypothetical protein